ncbi:MAG: hypothetical protein FWH48_07605 [Oscillospiraceae bacterium]|nr:hypothetical protein [Oscillospiraceae bacterium]
MDKQKDDIIDDIGTTDEIEKTEEVGEEMELPETLMGATTDEDEEEEQSEEEKEAEQAQNRAPGVPDLADFLEEDDDSAKETKKQRKEKELEREEIEREIRAKIAQEKKIKLKLARNISIVVVAVLLVVGAGLFMFLRIFSLGSGYIMKFDNKKVSMDEFEFFMLMNMLNQTSYEPQAAIDELTRVLVLEKAAKQKNIELSDDEKSYISANAEYMKSYLDEYSIVMPNISDERLEEILSVNSVIYYELIDIVAKERGYAVDETDFAAILGDFFASDKLLKYIITSTPEAGEAAREALASGLSTDDAVKQYSTYYEMYGTIDMISANQIGLAEDEYNAIMALGELECSEVIFLDADMYAVFIVLTDEETESTLRDDYAASKKSDLFLNEYAIWVSEANIQINQKAFDEFDSEEFFNTLFS